MLGFLIIPKTTGHTTYIFPGLGPWRTLTELSAHSHGGKAAVCISSPELKGKGALEIRSPKPSPAWQRKGRPPEDALLLTLCDRRLPLGQC